jgi:hypothetical protein
MKMLEKISFIGTLLILLVSCNPSKKITGSGTPIEPVVVPEGIEFQKIENYKDYAVLFLPIKGRGFTYEVAEQTDTGQPVPNSRFHSTTLTKSSRIYETEGDLDVQFEKVKEKYLKWYIKENSEIHFEKMMIGRHNVARVQLYTPNRNGSINFNYGYLVQHGEYASCFMVIYAAVTPSQLEARKATLDEALQYTIKTLEYR